MNNILSKILCGIGLLISSSCLLAGTGKDSSQLLANNTSSSVISIIKEANVLYPAALQMHMDESREYVEKFSNKKRSYLIHLYQKGKKLFPKITAVLKRYHLPEELKVLMALESGFNANAISGAGAVGYWQIMDEAAKEYGLHIADTKTGAKNNDDRKNFSKSTLAAAQYLRDRGRNLNNDLLLIVASYNCGIGNVWQAMRKSGKMDPDFWDIKKYLPTETKNYVMNFIALNVIFFQLR